MERWKGGRKAWTKGKIDGREDRWKDGKIDGREDKKKNGMKEGRKGHRFENSYEVTDNDQSSRKTLSILT